MKEMSYRTVKDFIVFKVNKNYNYNVLFSLIPEIKIILQKKHFKKAVIDIRGITTEIPLDDRREMAKLVALLFDSSYKLAVLNTKRNNVKVAKLQKTQVLICLLRTI